MKIQLLIAVNDVEYAEHLAKVLAEKHADVAEVTLSTSVQNLRNTLEMRMFDAALISAGMIEGHSLNRIRVPLLLWEESELLTEVEQKMTRIRKYQRISSMVSDILEQCAKADVGSGGYTSKQGFITTVWSPSGGCGKTTAALAYAAFLSVKGSKTTYLDLEPFSSAEVFFGEDGKSISVVFEKMDGNIEMLLKSAEKQDASSGIYYFNRPNNYDDINALSVEDIALLAEKCAGCTEQLVIDTAGNYDDKLRKLMEISDRVLLVMDGSKVGQEKLKQFQAQNDLFELIQGKTVLVLNRGAAMESIPVWKTVSLPQIDAKDPSLVYKTLSVGFFDAITK